MERKFNTIDEAAEALRQGQIIVVIDDPDRENEGDLICAARHATTANVNFMACYGKGLICMPMSSALTQKLGLGQMVSPRPSPCPSTTSRPVRVFRPLSGRSLR